MLGKGEGGPGAETRLSSGNHQMGCIYREGFWISHEADDEILENKSANCDRGLGLETRR